MHQSTGATSRRVDNWPCVLNDIFTEYQARDFEWGTSDCATFATDTIKELIGVDLYAEFRGSYHDLRSYLKLLKTYEYSSIGELFNLVSIENGIFEIAPREAMRGDVCTYIGADGLECLGICMGPRAYFLLESGLIGIPIDKCFRSWRID